jgi:Protein of unknown function (DUF2793)
MAEISSRLALPLLAAGQAQKEITHNEALTLLDGLLHGAIESRVLTAPPGSPQAGQLWLIAAAPSGAWAGQAGKLGLWTTGGWRFISPVAGGLLWSKTDQIFGWFDGTVWHWGDWPVTSVKVGGVQVVSAPKPQILSPSGGSVIDSQARSALFAVLQALRDHGLILP